MNFFCHRLESDRLTAIFILPCISSVHTSIGQAKKRFCGILISANTSEPPFTASHI